jgi:pyruvate kinase
VPLFLFCLVNEHWEAARKRHNGEVRKTKIVATLGPASDSPLAVQRLVEAGVSVFRLNCSHLSSSALSHQIEVIRLASPSSAILVDIQGPKMRYGGEEIRLGSGQEIEFTYEILGLSTVASSGGLEDLATGHRMLLDDGRIEALVVAVHEEHVIVRVIKGGTLRHNKGVNLPDTEITGGLLSDKDREDISVAREADVEYVAVSFVQTANDVLAVRALLGDTGLVIAKIERPQALDSLAEICEVSDGLMAARGDLGVELPYEDIPVIQHRISRVALEYGIFSICATEMLESMITSSRPTRAEVADVSAAVLDGFDAVMLSAETAVGHDPAGAVEAMARICESSEPQVDLPNIFADAHPEKAAVTAATSALAKRISADCILSLTLTGFSARLLAACRPSAPIVAVTPSLQVARSLNLARNVFPIVAQRPMDVTEAIAQGLDAAREVNMIRRGQKVVICASRLNLRSDADTILLHEE